MRTHLLPVLGDRLLTDSSRKRQNDSWEALTLQIPRTSSKNSSVSQKGEMCINQLKLSVIYFGF